MKKLLAIAVAAVALTFCSVDNADAQGFTINTLNQGYGFGVGNNYSRGFHRNIRGRGLVFPGRIGFSQRIEEPPYFAKYPPVYYSGIVRRPYGVSPYAAPPGIVPVEMTHKPDPITVTNPYFDGEMTPVETVAPVADEAQPSADAVQNQSTHIYNPYIETIGAVESTSIFTNE